MADTKMRPWCAKAQYPELQPFMVGTAVLPEDTRHDEIEAALSELASKHLPSGFQLSVFTCGAILFVPEDSL